LLPQVIRRIRQAPQARVRTFLPDKVLKPQQRFAVQQHHIAPVIPQLFHIRREQHGVERACVPHLPHIRIGFASAEDVLRPRALMGNHQHAASEPQLLAQLIRPQGQDFRLRIA